MRKVTASAVILTALTGCGQNSGVPSTQWSFEVPAEDEITSLALSREAGESSDGVIVSAIGPQAFNAQSAVGELGSVYGDDPAGAMMGPAFNQSPATGATATELSVFSSPTSSYQSVANRPDPVAEVKAFLSANGSPSALSNRAPYRSDILSPSLPAVYLPSAASVTATLGDPTDIESQPAYVDNASFTSAGLPVIESAIGGMYSSSSNPTFAPPTVIASTQDRSIGQPVDYSSTSVLAVPTIEGLSAPAVSSGPGEPSSISEDGLPVLEATNPQEVSIGTAILQDLQRTETAQVAQNLPVEKTLNNDAANGSIVIEIMPTEESAVDDDLVVGVDAIRDRPDDVSANAPTLENLRRSMATQAASPLVAAYASQSAEADLAVESNRGVEAIAISSRSEVPTLESLLETMPETAQSNLGVEAIAVSSHSEVPTLESLLETMSETAAQANFVVDSPDNNAASPLLEGLSDTQPLSTLYLPIPEATSESDTDAALSTRVKSVRNSLASLSEIAPAAGKYQAALSSSVGSKVRQVTGVRGGYSREALSQGSRATLNLVNKLSAKRRQLAPY